MTVIFVIGVAALILLLTSCGGGNRVNSNRWKDEARAGLKWLDRVSLKKTLTLNKDESSKYFVAKNGGADDENQPRVRVNKNGLYKKIATKHGGGLTIDSTCKLKDCLFQFGETVVRQKSNTTAVFVNCTLIGEGGARHNMMLFDNTTTIFEGTTTLIDCGRGISQTYTEHGSSGPDDCGIPGGCHTKAHPNGSKVIMRGKVVLVNSRLGEVRHAKDSFDLTEATVERHGDCELVVAKNEGRRNNILM